jgi:hypothetical protein
MRIPYAETRYQSHSKSGANILRGVFARRMRTVTRALGYLFVKLEGVGG